MIVYVINYTIFVRTNNTHEIDYKSKCVSILTTQGVFYNGYKTCF